jgi:hypothetical protein
MRDARVRIAAWLEASAVAALVLGSAPAGAGKAHEHGVARADVGVEAGRIMLNIEVPLDDLVGFERAPRTDAERAAVAAALAKLQEAAKIARVDVAAGCQAAKVELSAPVWGVGSAAAAASAAPAKGNRAGAAHSDIEARYEWRCSHSDKTAHLELDLFAAFPRLKRVELQAVTSKGQLKLTLRRPNTRVALGR